MEDLDSLVLLGVKVLDLSQGAAGPLCTMMLGDFGAEIIKVEPPQGDWGRTLGPPFIGGESVLFLGDNRNKKSIVIDLKKDEGIAVLKRLASQCDVVVESFRPGVTDRLGIGYEDLKKLNDALIYCAVSAYGQTGPWKNKPGVDGIIQAVSGLMSTLGTEEGEPIKVPNPVVDFTAGLLATLGVLLALMARDRLGIGQRVDVNLFDASLTIQRATVSAYLESGELPRKTGSGAPYASPNEVYKTGDGYIMLAAYSPKRWETLCRLIGREELARDPRFLTLKARVANRKLLKLILEEYFENKTTAELCEVFEKADLICAPVENYDRVLSSEQVRVNEMVQALDHVKLGRMRVLGIPIKLSRTPGRIRSGAPLLGQDTREILYRFGYSEGEVLNLEKSGVVQVCKDEGELNE